MSASVLYSLVIEGGTSVSDVAHSCHDKLTHMCCRPVTVVVMAALEKENSLLTYEK